MFLPSSDKCKCPGQRRVSQKAGWKSTRKKLGDSIYLRPNDQHVLVPEKLSLKKLSPESLRIVDYKKSVTYIQSCVWHCEPVQILIQLL